jgi:cysteinyl-tRNA synthetase
MDLMFPHHENELAQSESATGKTFAKYWMHNGLTRIKTKLASGEWADEKMSGSLGNVVPAAELLKQHGPELMRYMLLSTQYRRPIEFTEDVLIASKKGLAVFGRLFERVERLAGPGPHAGMEEAAPQLLQGENGDFVRAVLGYKMKFMESMDDDFNTAGAIGSMHELAGAINSFIERTDVEKSRAADQIESVAAGTQSLRSLGNLLGLFLHTLPGAMPVGATLAGKETSTVQDLMDLLIRLRTEARTSKNFALSDGIRDGLAQIGIVLEDRPDGTGWRKE